MRNAFSYPTATLLMQMNNLSIIAGRAMWLSFACLDTQHICCCRFRLGTLDLFNTMRLELTSAFATMAKTLAPHLSTLFQFVLKRVGKPIAWLILSVPYALLALYSLALAPSSNLGPNLKLKENSNQSRRHHTLSASYTSKRMLPLHLLRQRHWGRFAISFFASLMLLNRASSRYGGNCKC